MCACVHVCVLQRESLNEQLCIYICQRQWQLFSEWSVGKAVVMNICVRVLIMYQI